MKPVDFVVFAGRVVSFGPAGARSAISRAYYGAMHLALELLKDLAGEAPGSGRAHVLVPRFLSSSQDADAIQASKILGDLHTSRIRADYRLQDSFTEVMACAMDRVAAAEDVGKHLALFAERCRQDPAVLTSLREGIARVKAVHQ